MTKDQLLCVRRWMCWRQKKGRQTLDFHFLCPDGHIRKIVCHKISHLIKQMDAKVWGALFLQVDALAAPQNRHLRNAQGRAGPRRAATWPCQRWRATSATPSSSLRSGGRTSATSWMTMWSRSRRETRADVEKISQDVFPSLTFCTIFSSSHDYPVAADDCPTRLEITIVSVTFSIDHCKTIMSEMRSWFFWLIDGQRQQGLFKTVKLRNMFSWFVI